MKKRKAQYWNMDRLVYLQAASAVLGGLVLAQWVHPAWIGLTVFAGLNLLQASFTGVCPSTYFYRKMGIPSGYVFEGAPPGEREG